MIKKNKMSFLKAEWRKLIMANYQVDKKVLEKYVPHKTELDIWNDKLYVSLVGFMFLNTRVRGIKIPLHINFEEVNLRFYVKYKDGNIWKRGVVFIKEIVPKAMITFVANTLYREHYATLSMRHRWEEKENNLYIEYEWKHKNSWDKLSVIAENKVLPISKGSEAEFITEHYWGYTQVASGKTFEYEVTHPTWQQYKVKEHEVKIDFASLYGDDFKVLNELEASSVFLAEGSEITVEGRKKI